MSRNTKTATLYKNITNLLF